MPAKSSAESRTAHSSFAALRHRGYRYFFIGTATAMLGDNVEHVVTYWAMFQKFHSPSLGGFAVISHWVPYLLFSGYSGALADRFDPRRMIQLGMLLFMAVSASWGVLITTGALQEWHAWILLSVHGCAGVLWGPAAQLLIHDIVGPAELPSGVRLAAIARYAGTLLGAGGRRLADVAVRPSTRNLHQYLDLSADVPVAMEGAVRLRDSGGQASKAAHAAIRGLGDAFATVTAPSVQIQYC